MKAKVKRQQLLSPRARKTPAPRNSSPYQFLHLVCPPYEGTFEEFSRIYRQAGDELAGSHVTGERWALPIIFLYRHSVELFVKGILTEFGAEVGICKHCVLARSHDLRAQLPDLKTLAASCGFPISAESEGLLEAWEKDDPLGMWSRFPLSKKGTPTELVKKGAAFDLEKFRNIVQNLFEDLGQLLTELRRQSI